MGRARVAKARGYYYKSRRGTCHDYEKHAVADWPCATMKALEETP